MEEIITFVGMDVHKKSISVAIAEGGSRGEARFVGVFPNTAGALTKLAGTLAKPERTGKFTGLYGICQRVLALEDQDRNSAVTSRSRLTEMKR